MKLIHMFVLLTVTLSLFERYALKRKRSPGTRYVKPTELKSHDVNFKIADILYTGTIQIVKYTGKVKAGFKLDIKPNGNPTSDHIKAVSHFFPNLPTAFINFLNCSPIEEKEKEKSVFKKIVGFLKKSFWIIKR